MNVIRTICDDGGQCIDTVIAFCDNSDVGPCLDVAAIAAKTDGGGPIVLPAGTIDVATTIGHLGISVIDLLVIYGALACVIYVVAAFMMWPRRPGKTR